MSRRRIVALASAAALLALCVLAVALVVGVTQTGTGQEYIRRLVTEQLAPRVRGTLYVGRISGSFLGGVTVDSVEIRGPDDSLFVAAGRIRVRYDVRDLLDRRVLLKHVEVEHPVVRIEQAETGEWNYNRVFVRGPEGPADRGRGGWNFIVADSVSVRDGAFVLVMPWHPADSLRGARRDSAIAYNLARRDLDIRRRGRHFTRTWRWTDGDVELSHLRLADPDSAGRFFALARLDVNETDPPFRWRNVRGDVRWLGDSIWADVAHWDLPGSTGTGRAKIVWGSNLPVRYDVRVRGDSVSLRDVAWVYPTLPRTGGGSMALTIRNDPRNLRVIEYGLSDMDVRSTGSRLRGRMTFAVGGPVLAVKDVAMEAAPVDFDLLRTLAGGPFPYDWQGTITGTVRARGGPLDRFVVDEARFAFDDRNVPGAVSRGTARGGLDILFPAFTTFRGLDVQLERLDLRTPRALNPNFPPLGGIVSGRARLDSSWLDVRFRDADLTHTDGPGPASRLLGSGRVTLEDDFIRYDLDVRAEPLSLTTLARSYPELPLRGVVSGPLRLAGTVDDLRVTTTLAGAAGTVSFDGRVDAFEPSYAAVGTGSAVGLDLRTLLAQAAPRAATANGDAQADTAARGAAAAAPTTSLNFRYDVDARGATAADLAGSLVVDLERSMVDGIRVYGGIARLGFGDGRVRVDTLDVESTALRVQALGALGLAPHATDTLRVSVAVDSLGGLRSYLTVAPSLDDTAAVAPDSLAGSLSLSGTLAGTIDTTAGSPGLALDARLQGEGLVVGGTRVAAVAGVARVVDLLRAPAADVELAADSLRVGALLLGQAEATFVTDTAAIVVAETPAPSDTAWRPGAPAPRRAPRAAVPRSTGGGRVRAVARATARPQAGRFALRAGSTTVGADSGVSLAAVGRTTFTDATTLVVVDSAGLSLGEDSRYRLLAPARLTLLDSNGVQALDSLVLVGEGASAGARVAVAGYLQDEGPVTAVLAVERVPVHDVAHATGVEVPGTGYDGRLGVRAEVAGTRAEPRMDFRAAATDIRVAGVTIGELGASGRYAERRLGADVRLMGTGGHELLTASASLPVDLALLPLASRQLPDTLRAQIRADSLDLALAGALVPGLQEVAGRVRAGVDLGGTWRRPLVRGAVRVDGGAATVLPAGIRVEGVTADVALVGDTVMIRRLAVRSGGPADTASLGGWVTFASLTQPEALDLRLTMRNFLAIDRRRVATLWLSTPEPIRVTGPYLGATVRGAVRAERGRIYIPELIDKRVVDLNEYRDVVDTTVFRNRSLLPGAPSAFVEGLVLQDVRVEVGDDVWLRSPEANIKLGGELAVTTAVDRTGGRARTQLVPLGTLNVERGTYALDLIAARPVFQVEPGSLRFFGTDLNPTLDIKAVHVVRQAGGRNTNRPDVRVQVNIAGTLNQPTLQLSSADNPPIPDTDLISYLVTGEPAAAVLGQQQGLGGTEQAVALGLRYAGSLLSGALTGGRFDIVQVETGGLSGLDAVGVRQSSLGILERTRLGVGGQLGPRTFYTFSTGLCGITTPSEQGAVNAFVRALGFRIEHRLTPTLSVQLGFEPGAAQQACGRTPSALVLQQTPPQGGIDFSKSWAF